MDHQIIIDPSKTRRDDVRLPVSDKPDVADESLVKDRVDNIAVKAATFWQAFKCRAFSFHTNCAHETHEKHYVKRYFVSFVCFAGDLLLRVHPIVADADLDYERDVEGGGGFHFAFD